MVSEYEIEYSEKSSAANKKIEMILSSYGNKTVLSPKEHCENINKQLSKYIDQYVEKYGINKTKCNVYFALSCDDK